MPGAGHARVQREEQIEGFGVAHLADDELDGAHAQRLFHESAQAHRAGSPRLG